MPFLRYVPGYWFWLSYGVLKSGLWFLLALWRVFFSFAFWFVFGGQGWTWETSYDNAFSFPFPVFGNAG